MSGSSARSRLPYWRGIDGGGSCWSSVDVRARNDSNDGYRLDACGWQRGAVALPASGFRASRRSLRRGIPGALGAEIASHRDPPVATPEAPLNWIPVLVQRVRLREV